MKRLKYALSILLLLIVTAAALCLPGIYFQNYQYDASIEDMEEYSYDEMTSSNATAWQVYKMMDNGNYTEMEIYPAQSADEKEQIQTENKYREMVQRVFEKYISIVNGEYDDGTEREVSNELEMTLSDYFTAWMKEEEQWTVDSVYIYNLTDVFHSKVVNVQLYLLNLVFPDSDSQIQIFLNPDTDTFYCLYVEDNRYKLEFIDEENMRWEIYAYYTMADHQWLPSGTASENLDFLMDNLEIATFEGGIAIRY